MPAYDWPNAPFQPAEVWQARARIRPYIWRTPLLYSRALSRRTGGEIYLKMECWQIHGCFKVRGAVNMVAALSPEERERGLVTASSGNHGTALAYAAGLFGGQARVFLPKTADLAKVGRIRSLGGDPVLFGENYTAALDAAQAYAGERGATYVHSHGHPLIIAGQGTIGLEVLEDLPDPDLVVVPVGGGGILSGVATAIRSANWAVRIAGAESAAAPGGHLSFRDGYCHERTPLRPSIADGISGTLTPLTYAISRPLVERIALAEDDEIIAAMRALQEDEQVIVEGAAAVGLAVILNRELDVRGLRTVIILTSRNIDAARYNRLIAGL